MSITRGKKILLEKLARKMKKIISALILCIALIVLCVQIQMVKYKGTVHQHGRPLSGSVPLRRLELEPKSIKMSQSLQQGRASSHHVSDQVK